MITPAHHRVHHGLNDIYIDKNFGGTLVIWDKIFGTFQLETAEDPIVFGTSDHVKTNNLFWANNIPLLKLIEFKAKDVRYKIQGFVLGLAALILFGLLLNYILYEDVWSNEIKIFLFTIIFIGTLAIGGVSEGRYWGLTLWVITGIVLPIIFIASTLNYWMLNICFGVLFIHVLYTVFTALTKRSIYRINEVEK